MGYNSIVSFAKGDSGWTGEENTKAKAMLRRKKADGSPRYTDEDIARHMGMTVEYVARLRRNYPEPKRKGPGW